MNNLLSILTSIFLIFVFSCTNNSPQLKDSHSELKDSIIINPKYSNQFLVVKRGAKFGIFIGMSKSDTLQKFYFEPNETRKVACLSSTIVGYLAKLGMEDNIIAIDNKNYVCNTHILKNISDNKCNEIANSGELNIEKTIQINPEFIFTNQSDNKSYEKLKSVSPQIQFVTCLDYLETSPLAKAEWIKLFGIIFNCQKKADSLFSVVETNYLNLCQLSDTCLSKPTVLSQLSYGDTWYCPGGKSYISKLLQDAGAQYVFQSNSNSGSIPYSFEKVFSTCSKTDYWIDLFNCNTKIEVLALDKKYASFDAFKKGNLYNNNAKQIPSGANPIHESGVMEPDIILSDLIRIFHPTILPNHQLVYYKQIK